MFVRFRRRGARLHATLVANQREAGRVRQRHVASLGVLRDTFGMAAWVSPYQRGRMWQNFFEEADRLGLDLDATRALARVLQEQAPFPTPAAADHFYGKRENRDTVLCPHWPEICKRQLALRDTADEQMSRP
jgi:hypothetical protein